jgi:hypothetical protein
MRDCKSIEKVKKMAEGKNEVCCRELDLIGQQIHCYNSIKIQIMDVKYVDTIIWNKQINLLEFFYEPRKTESCFPFLGKFN